MMMKNKFIIFSILAFAVSRSQHKDVEIGINDNGFYITSPKKIMLMKAFKLIKSKDIDKLMDMAIDKTEVLNRRFRHCAARSLMILRNYKGRVKRVGRQQVSSMILMAALRRINPNFSILKEAKREVLEDLMDIKNTKEILKQIEAKKIRVQEVTTLIPSPFAFSLIAQGYTDIMKIEDKIEFLKRMHQNVLAKISTKKDIDKNYLKKQIDVNQAVDYQELWEKEQQRELTEQEEELHELRLLMWNQHNVPRFAKEELVKLIDGDENIRKSVIDSVHKYKKEIMKEWPKKLRDKVFKRIKEIS
jgi:hypothetical protein